MVRRIMKGETMGGTSKKVRKTTISGGVSEYTQMKFYTYCNLFGVKASDVIRECIENWIAAKEMELLPNISKTCETKECKETASQKQKSYIIALASMLNEPVAIQNIKTYEQADAEIKRLLDIKKTRTDSQLTLDWHGLFEGEE